MKIRQGGLIKPKLNILFYGATGTGKSTVAGIVGIFCGSSALYCAFAQVLNEVYGKKVMPL